MKKHIIKWRLHRNLQYADVRTALHLLGPDRTKWPSTNPRFRIREREVDFQDVARYLRRKGIQDPVEWAACLDEVFEPSANVVIIEPQSASKAQPPPMLEPGDTEWDFSLQQYASDSALTSLPQRSAETPPLLCSTSICQVDDPEIYCLLRQAIFHTRNYCLGYLNSCSMLQCPKSNGLSTSNSTWFCNSMAYGIYFLSRKSYLGAFRRLNRGFDLLQEAFTEEGATMLANYLQVICSLTIRGTTDIVQELLEHTLQLMKILPNTSESLRLLLSVISKSDQRFDLSLLSLKAAADVFESERDSSWQYFEIANSYCIGLHDAKMFGEESMRRRRLLARQETQLGHEDCSTVWTRTLVADDLRAEWNFEAAIEQYQKVLGACSSLPILIKAETESEAHLGPALAIVKPFF